MNKQNLFTAVGGAILFGGILFSGPPAKAQDAAAPVSSARPGDDVTGCACPQPSAVGDRQGTWSAVQSIS